MAGRERFEGKVTRFSVYVAARDGTRLAVDVYRPETGGGVPAVLLFTPYYRRFDLQAGGLPILVRGWGSIGTFSRGMGMRWWRWIRGGRGLRSGAGAGMRAPAERTDYHDVVDWVSRQEWCSGAVGITGISYVGAAGGFSRRRWGIRRYGL